MLLAWLPWSSAPPAGGAAEAPSAGSRPCSAAAGAIVTGAAAVPDAAAPAPPAACLQRAPLRRCAWRPAPWLACCAPWCTARCEHCFLGGGGDAVWNAPAVQLLLAGTLWAAGGADWLRLRHCPVLPTVAHWLLPPIPYCSSFSLCPAQTVKYNMKKRAGRGFTLEELKVRPWSMCLLLLVYFCFSMHRSFTLEERKVCVCCAAPAVCCFSMACAAAG